MPVRLELTQDLIGLNTRYSGVISDADLRLSYELKLANPDYLGHIKYILTDFTEVTEVDVTVIQAKSFAQKTYDILEPLNTNLLLVSVVPTEVLLEKLQKQAIVTEQEHELESVVPSRDIAITVINQHLTKISPRELYYSNVFLDHLVRTDGVTQDRALRMPA